MRFYIKANPDLEGWNIIEKDGIQSEEGFEDSVIATFYEFERVVLYCDLLNGNLVRIKCDKKGK